jgi:hypothetical protein
VCRCKGVLGEEWIGGLLFKYTKRGAGGEEGEGEDGSSKEDALSCFLGAFV